MPTTDNFFAWVLFILQKYGPLFWAGTKNTLLVALTGTIIGFVIGLFVAILRTIPTKPKDAWYKKVPVMVLSFLLGIYIEVFRGMGYQLVGEVKAHQG